MNNEKIWKYINGELPEEEKASVLRWIKEKPERIAEYHRLKRDFSFSGSSDHITDESIARHYDTLLGRIQASGKKINGLFTELLKYAAVVALTFLTAYYIFSHSDQSSKDSSKVLLTQVETMAGQSSKVTLPDGTAVWLNSASSLTYAADFGQHGQREVTLQGEAFFDVTRDTLKPFKVSTSEMVVKVLGTSFNMEAYDGSDVVTTLVEGKVQINSPGGTKLSDLKPGEQITLSLATNKLEIKEVDTRYYASWKDGYIILNNVRLEDIAPKLERFYNVNMVLKNKRVKDIVINGRGLRNMPVDQLMRVLKMTYGLDYKIESSLEEITKITVY
ncbi:FecR family protein [Saccharicrinis carchari]|uniref:FecR family protein n=1 Tax=Saccharicrinis carchari TaxID=1168039 RepID=A0A521BZ09_SACCC|nr:FecR domain-containing protein [Saccharicrinis carchari]SMO52413.1 FecR family protein [Saccharicrinis carchari]